MVRAARGAFAVLRAVAHVAIWRRRALRHVRRSAHGRFDHHRIRNLHLDHHAPLQRRQQRPAVCARRGHRLCLLRPPRSPPLAPRLTRGGRARGSPSTAPTLPTATPALPLPRPGGQPDVAVNATRIGGDGGGGGGYGLVCVSPTIASVGALGPLEITLNGSSTRGAASLTTLCLSPPSTRYRPAAARVRAAPEST